MDHPEEETGADRPLSARVGTFRDTRSEVRRQMRDQKRFRLVALGLAVLMLVVALPLYLGIQSATKDPVFASLDALEVPAWASAQTVDGVSGSRWCLIDCRFRERTVESERSPDETATVYEQALTEDGWRPWKPAYCPEQPVDDGHYTCWQRDELTLDLWVRAPACASDPLRDRPTVDPSVAPSGEVPGESTGEPAPAAPPAGEQLPGTEQCEGSVVSVKVRNAIDDDRLKPQPSVDPSFTGEDPDPIFTDDPLSDLTPSPS